MICSTIRRTLSILTACSLLAAPAVLLTGCGSNSDSAASQQATASNGQSLNPYIDAINHYNRGQVTCDVIITPSLDSLRKGERKEYIFLPDFEKLKDTLEKARSDPKVAGVYPDIDAAADDLLAILKDLAPLADKMEAYYSSKGYMADGYAESDRMAAQFLPLYDQFDAAYDKFDATVTKHFKELRVAQLEEMRKDGRVNAANYLELTIKTRELVDMLDKENVDKGAAEAKIAEINDLSGKLSDVPALGSYKSNLNRFIGTVRSYLAGQADGNKVIDDFNDLVRSSQNLDLGDLDKKK